MSNTVGEVEAGLLARMRKTHNALDQESRRFFELCLERERLDRGIVTSHETHDALSAEMSAMQVEVQKQFEFAKGVAYRVEMDTGNVVLTDPVVPAAPADPPTAPPEASRSRRPVSKRPS